MRTIFVDRDGVINVDHGYIGCWERVEFIDSNIKTMASLSKDGTQFFIITNQSGISRGYYSETEYRNIQTKIEYYLLNQGIRIVKTYYCPHYYQMCDCRKPNPGMVKNAMREFSVDLSSCALVGDKLTDLVSGARAGINDLYLVGAGLKTSRSLSNDVAIYSNVTSYVSGGNLEELYCSGLLV